MNMANRVKLFIISIFRRIFQLFWSDHGAVAEHHPPPAAAVDQHNFDCAIIMIDFCMQSAIEIALQSLQTQSQQKQFPPMFELLSLTIMLSFTFLFVCRFMSSRFSKTAQVLERVGLLFALTAIFVAITIPVSWFLKCVA